MARGPITLLAAGVAGFLIWAATQINDHKTSGYWAVYAILAGAGLIFAASQFMGGVAGGGRAAISPSVLLFAFVPALIVVGWIVVAGQPHGNSPRSQVLTWSSDLGVGGIVRDLVEYVGVLAFGLGAMLGLTLVPAAPTAAPVADVRDWRTTTQAGPARPVGPVGAATADRQPVGVGNGASRRP
jgi:hypothetical protein